MIRALLRTSPRTLPVWRWMMLYAGALLTVGACGAAYDGRWFDAGMRALVATCVLAGFVRDTRLRRRGRSA
ncbi:hypothetical protein ACFT5B_16620 [Luteimicrobium sp. NPDC057192]|uniref:hypothetical protein n=1 Tax=Luteimicrobium sp. NPDC057192 TaxID=3346042 RepID=UPI003637E232